VSDVIDYQDNPRNHTRDTILCFEAKSECDAWQYVAPAACSQPTPLRNCFSLLIVRRFAVADSVARYCPPLPVQVFMNAMDSRW
jgi:hypothetical protein